MKLRINIAGIAGSYKRNSFVIWTMAPALVYLLIFFVFITVFMMKLALTYTVPEPDLFPSLLNFKALFDRDFYLALARTVVFVAVSTPVQLLVGLVMALLLKRSFRGQGLLRGIAMIPIAIPTIVTAVIMLMLFDYPFGIINNVLTGKVGSFFVTGGTVHWEQYSWFPRIMEGPVNWQGNSMLALGTAMVGNVWSRTPIAMLILLAGLQSVDDEQYEAARIMGAGRWAQFKYITVPSIMPAISSVLILRSIEVWKEFIFPFILAPAYPVLGVMIRKAYYDKQDPGLAAAIALVLVLCIALSTVVLTLLLKRLKKLLTAY